MRAWLSILIVLLFLASGCNPKEQVIKEPVSLSIEEAQSKLSFGVQLPTKFPFEVEHNKAQMFDSDNPTEVVFSFWSLKPDKEVNLKISKNGSVIEFDGEPLEMPKGKTARYKEKQDGLDCIQTLKWEDNRLVYELDYRSENKISIDELMMILNSFQ